MPCQLTETLNICLKLATDLVFPNKRGQTVPENSTAIVPNCAWKRYRTVAFFGREGRCDKIKEEAINRSSLCFLLFFSQDEEHCFVWSLSWTSSSIFAQIFHLKRVFKIQQNMSWTERIIVLYWRHFAMLLFTFLVYSFFMKDNSLTTSFIISFFTSLSVSVSVIPDFGSPSRKQFHGARLCSRKMMIWT